MWLDHLLSREIEAIHKYFKNSLHPKVEAVEIIYFYRIILEIMEAELMKLFSDYFALSVQTLLVH